MPGMKHSTIKKLIRKKLKEWYASIPFESVRIALEKNTIVSGGCITSMLLGEEINDYDVYFRNKETARLAAEYYTKVFNENQGKLATSAAVGCNPEVKILPRTNIRGETEERIIIYMKSSGVAAEGQSTYHYFESLEETDATEFVDNLNGEDTLFQNAEKEPIEYTEEMLTLLRNKELRYKPVFFSENAITLSGRMQLVIRFYGEPAQIHDNYDFAHCMCWYDPSTDELNVSAEAMESMLSKCLIYKGSLYPVASLFRIRKFINRGWRITAGQMLKIITQVSKINLSDLNILREQLIGVDQAYMHQLISALEKTGGKHVDATYLAKLIDEIFE